ncbi:alpha/beta hydrolase [Roseovarius sp. EL26]|uniref:alpha/beta hydrolase n=1 Tax=Roseovarius sp. EL26 TaxID=2126672 RepID=UPI0020B14202|nr:alpha/beta fold hydrolase [Roseovarius sp. EL26]
MLFLRIAKRGFMIGLFVGLASCGPRYHAQRAAPSPNATITPVYVATGRALDKTGPAFGARRTAGLNYFRADVSIPPTHTPGHIEVHKGEANADEHFVVTATRVYETAGDFRSQVMKSAPNHESIVFVHGYNNTLSEAMFRSAQIKHDFEGKDPMVLFSWQSAGSAKGYIYDRDSVMFARDDLEDLLNNLTKGKNDKVFLFAHSIGSHLAMETLRQAALRGDQRLLSRISGVVLMSPDLDIDVFKRQAAAIGELPQPFFIFTTQDDKALGLAALVTGKKPRLGLLNSTEEVEGLGVTIIDFTALEEGEGGNHAVPVSSPAAISILQGIGRQAELGTEGFSQYLALEAPLN